MLIIPVLDLLHGQAVHALRGERHRYPPLESVLLPGRTGDALGLARAYRQKLGARHCYIADLDAIQGGPPQGELLARIVDPAVGFGPGILLDAGISTPHAAESALGMGAASVVIGLETMSSFAELECVVAAVGGGRVFFSLDLREGVPLHRGHRLGVGAESPLDLALMAAEAGVAGIIVLDLAAVGSGTGPRHMELLSEIKRQTGITLYSGGGIRSPEDIALLEQAGCDGALVGTAVHTGAIRL